MQKKLVLLLTLVTLLFLYSCSNEYEDDIEASAQLQNPALNLEANTGRTGTGTNSDGPDTGSGRTSGRGVTPPPSHTVEPLAAIVVIKDGWGNSKTFFTSNTNGIAEISLFAYGWDGRRISSFQCINLTDEAWLLEYFEDSFYKGGVQKLDVMPSSSKTKVDKPIIGSNDGVQGAIIAFTLNTFYQILGDPIGSFRFIPKRNAGPIIRTPVDAAYRSSGRYNSDSSRGTGDNPNSGRN